MTLFDRLPGVLPNPRVLDRQQRHLGGPRIQRGIRAAFRRHHRAGVVEGPCGRRRRGQQRRAERRPHRERVFVAIVVVMFAGIPFIDVDLNTIQYDSSRSAQCQVSVAQRGYRLVAVLQHHQQPVGEGAGVVGVHARALARRHGRFGGSDPCGTDLRQMRMEIDATRIDDPVLAQEVADFSRDCYGPARAKLFMQRPQLDEQQMHDVTWIGSRFFTDTNGYYDTYRSSTHARTGPMTAPATQGLRRWPAVAATRPAASGGAMEVTACGHACWVRWTRAC